MSKASDLRARLQITPYPDAAFTTVGAFELWTSYLDGYLLRLAEGAPLDHKAAAMMRGGADDETQRLVSSLRAKPELSDGERGFLHYWALLEEARQLILDEAESAERRRGP